MGFGCLKDIIFKTKKEFNENKILRLAAFNLIVGLFFLTTSCDFFQSFSDEGRYGLASKYFHKEEYLKAIKFLNKIQSPNEDMMAKTYYSLGRCYKMLNQFDKAFDSYYKVYTEFPASNLADDALAMSGGMLYSQGKYKNALDIYRKFMKEYPNSDVRSIRIWESMELCLAKFKKYGNIYAYNEQVIQSDEFLKIVLEVTQHRNSYLLLDRFNFWEEYSRKYQPKNKFRLEFIQSLLENSNFLEAERQMSVLSRDQIPFARYLKISKLYQLGKYKQVIKETEQWLSNFNTKVSIHLLTDCIILRIESMMKSGSNDLEILNELNYLFNYAKNTPFQYVLRINPKLTKANLLSLSKKNKSSPLVYFLLAQRYLKAGDFKKCQEYFKEGLSKIPNNNSAFLERGKVLNEILDILDGYYFSINKEDYNKIFVNNLGRILKSAQNFNQVAGKTINKNKKKIDLFLRRNLVNIKKIDQLSEYKDRLPVDSNLLEKVFENTHTFQNILKVVLYDYPWQEKITIFSKYKVKDIPTYTGAYYLDNMYYDSVKTLYLLYMKEGFSKEMCNALFLQHLVFLREEGILSIYGKFFYPPRDLDNSDVVDDLPEEGYHYYYYRKDDTGGEVYRIKYYKVDIFKNETKLFMNYRFDVKNYLKYKLRKIAKESKEYLALSAYLESLTND